jgi:hypothetical protein
MSRNRKHIEINPVTEYATLADMPTAADFGAGMAMCQDTGHLYISNATTWRVMPLSVAQNGIPFIYLSSATIGNNGALSAVTTLPATYTKAYVYCPVGAIFTASPAGWYYAVMSSATAGTIYQEMYTSGVPTIPATPTAWVKTGPGAFTQTTAGDIVVASIPLAAGVIAVNGKAVVTADWWTTVNANAKTANVKFGTTVMHDFTLTSLAVAQSRVSIKNRGVANSQVNSRASLSIGGTSATGAAKYTAVDTSAAQTVNITINSGVATDSIVLESFAIEVFN